MLSINYSVLQFTVSGNGGLIFYHVARRNILPSIWKSKLSVKIEKHMVVELCHFVVLSFISRVNLVMHGGQIDNKLQ